MSEAAAKKTTTNKKGVVQPGREGWFIAVQLLDMTWRVALPILILSYLGTRLDKSNGTNPTFTLIGFFTSLFIATLLVYRQIKALYPNFFKEWRQK